MDRDEELLIRRAQRGNLQAFEELVHRYDTRILKVAYDMVNNIEDARDIYQDIFIKVYRSIHKFRFQSEFFSWLFRITVNTCINYRRQRSNKMNFSLDEHELEDVTHWKTTIQTDVQNPEEQFINKELDNLIKKSIDELSSQQRAVFVLRHYHGYKLKEIASMMDCSEGTIKNYLFRATQKLQKSLRPYHQL